MIDRDLELALITSIKCAKLHRHKHVTIKHMLYGLLHDKNVQFIFDSCDIPFTEIEVDLVDNFFPEIALTVQDELPEQTNEFNRVLQRAVNETQKRGDRKVTTLDVLQSINSENDSESYLLLKKYNVYNKKFNIFLNGNIELLDKENEEDNSHREFNEHKTLIDMVSLKEEELERLNKKLDSERTQREKLNKIYLKEKLEYEDKLSKANEKIIALRDEISNND